MHVRTCLCIHAYQYVHVYASVCTYKHPTQYHIMQARKSYTHLPRQAAENERKHLGLRPQVVSHRVLGRIAAHIPHYLVGHVLGDQLHVTIDSVHNRGKFLNAQGFIGGTESANIQALCAPY